MFSESLLFHLWLQECLIILVLCLDGGHLSLVEKVTILNVLIMLLDIAFLTFLAISKLFLVFGQGFFNYDHRVVSISHVRLRGICPSFWLRLQNKFIEAKFEFFALHLFWCLTGRKLQIIVATGPQVLSVLHSWNGISSQMPWNLFVAVFALRILLSYKIVTHQSAHIIG